MAPGAPDQGIKSPIVPSIPPDFLFEAGGGDHSKACTTTKPGPCRTIWTASPEPPRSADDMFIELWNPGVSVDDQQTAALRSTYTGCWGQSRTIGLPTTLIATVPVPVRVVLNRPPAIRPETLIRLMSPVKVASKASRSRRLMLIHSHSQWTRLR